MNAVLHLSSLVVVWADKVPADKDVTAGWVAFGVFIALGLAVTFLGFSLTKHLRRANRNAERGVFDPSDEGQRRPS